jgi:hypothetical protein
MYFIGLDVHKKTISYCVKDAAGRVHREGKIGATSVSGVTMSDALALRNVCRRRAISDFLNNAR